MKVGDLENIVKEVVPFHDVVLEPVYKKINIPVQTAFKGIYPSASRRTHIMGSFYEALNRGLYGGILNDKKFDVDFYNGEAVSRSIKPDVIDERNKIGWESKAAYFDKECEIMKRQLEGYKFLQYKNPETTYLVSIYRHILPEIKKRERTEEEVIRELLKSTIFSVVLPLSVILKLQETPTSNDIRLARNYRSKNQNWPDCLCIDKHTINRFLINPLENFDLLGFDPQRFQIERYLSPSNITINRRKVKQFPILRIFDKKYEGWAEEFMADYERDMEKSEDEINEELPIFEELKELDDIPF